MKKVLLIALLLPAALGLQGCRDSEVALGVGLVGGAIIGAAIADGDSGHHHHRTCHGGYVTRCNDWRDRRGRHHRDCRQVYDSCADVYNKQTAIQIPGFEFDASELEQANGPKVSTASADLSEKYGMDIDGSEKLVTALQAGAKGDLGSLAQLGLNRDELKSIYNGAMPSWSAVIRLSDETNTDIGQVQVMLKDVVKKVSAEKAKNKAQWKPSERSSR